MLQWSLANLLAWGVQVAAIVAGGLLLPVLLRLRAPGARLVFLRALLLACVALPLLQPWAIVPATSPASADVQPPAAVSGAVDAPSETPPAEIASPLADGPAPGRRLPWQTIGIGVLAVGIVCRLAWLALGLLSLMRLRRLSTALDPQPEAVEDATLAVGARASFRVSTRVQRPVTFGLRHPVVLVPEGFLEFAPAEQSAIACHELLHVRRRDWLRTLAEEVVCAVLWFHPAIWWLVDQIHLTVEQVIDRRVVRLIGNRRSYLQALLRLAATGPEPVLQPAALFLKHGHLRQRVAMLVKETPMSRIRLAASFAVVLAVLAWGGWLVVQAFPLSAESATGPLPAVVTPSSADALRALPVMPPPPAASEAKQATGGQQTRPTVDPKLQQAAPGMPAPPPPDSRKLKQAALVSKADFDRAMEALMQRAAAQPNDPEVHYAIAAYCWERVYRDAELSAAERSGYISKAMSEIDTALRLKPDYVEALIYKSLILRLEAGSAEDPAKRKTLTDSADELLDQAKRLREAQNRWPEAPPNAVRVGGNLPAPKKLKDVKPVYPAGAAEAGIQGVVILETVIGKGGTVDAVRVVRSIPLLDQAAIDAVRQWEFSPPLLNGAPVPVIATMTVNFTLAKSGTGVAGGVTGGVAGAGAYPPPPPPPPLVPLPPDTVRVGGNIRPPTRLVDAKPVYPAEARDARVQGVVIIEAVIGKDGKVIGAKILRSVPQLDQAALDAVRQWEFTPTLVNDVPMNVMMTVTVNFTLQ